MKWALAMCLAVVATPMAALEMGESEFRYVSDLAIEGFKPFASSQAGNASFGMIKGTDMYLCFIADTGEAQTTRQSTLLAELSGQTPARTVPNIPVVCILTQ